MRKSSYGPFGLIQLKKGTTSSYFGRVDIGKDALGRQIQKYVEGKSVYEVKENMLKNYAVELSKRIHIEDFSHLDDFALLFRFYYVRNDSLESYKGVRTSLNRARKFFGNPRLEDITTIEASSYLLSLSNLSNATQANYTSHLNHLFEKAKELGLIRTNPLDYCAKPRRIYKESRYFGYEAILSFLDASKDDCYYPIYVLMTLTGIRISEAISIQLCDILFDRKQIYLHQQFQGSKKELRIKHSLKGNKTRYLDISKETADFVFAIKESLKGKRNDYGLLFPDKDGKAINKGKIEIHIKKIADSIGLFGFTAHKFRHYFVSNMMELTDDPDFVRRLVGHTYYATTILYAHATKKDEKKMQQLEDYNHRVLERAKTIVF